MEGLFNEQAAFGEEQAWEEFRHSAKIHLDSLGVAFQDAAREQRGELEPEPETSTDIPDDPLPDVSSNLSSRTTARSHALSALDHLLAGYMPTHRARISSTHKPRGGVDGTLPQWVIFMGIEAWMPAEEVMEAYRTHQQALLAEQKPPRTKERAFKVAAFVWDQERLHGKRLSWAEMCKRWNELRSVKPFKGQAAPEDFQSNFRRGAKATLPHYRMSAEQITEAVRTRALEGLFDSWVSPLRE